MTPNHPLECLNLLEQDVTACVSALKDHRTDADGAILIGKVLGTVVRLEELRAHLPDAPDRSRLEAVRAQAESIQITPDVALALRGRFGDIVEHYRNGVRTFFDPANEWHADDLSYRDTIEDFRTAMRRRQLSAFVTDAFDEALIAVDRQLMSRARGASETEVRWVRDVRRVWCREQAYRWWWFLDDVQAGRTDSPSAPYWPKLT